MKVLQVNCVYNTGSTGKIMYDIHTELLKNGNHSIICYGRGLKTNDKNVYKTCGELYSKINNLLTRFSGIMYGGCFFSTNKLISVIKREAPDVVHLHCINGYFVNIYRLINWLKNNNIKTVLTLHAEFMHTANCGHAMECEKWKNGCGKCPRWKEETKSIIFDRTKLSFKKMKKAFDGFEENLIVVSVSPWLMERARQSPILMNKNHKVVLNGLDTSEFYYRNTEKLRSDLLLENKKTVVFVTPSFSLDRNDSKGGWYVIELAKQFPEVNFIIVGSKEEYLDLPKNVINIGRVESKKRLAELYSVADVTLLLSKRETFSMVAAESLCCGTPVLGFKAGGPECIALSKYSEFVEYGNLNEMKILLGDFLENREFLSRKISEEARMKFDKSNMYKGYYFIYDNLVKSIC